MTRGTARPDQLDPFWATFRAAHPGVDLVLLPDPARAETAAAAQTAETTAAPPEALEAREAQAGAVVDHLLDELDDRLAGRPGWPVVVPRTRVWRHDPWGRRYLECRVVAGDLGADQPVPLLRGVGNAFLDAGWRARPVPGDRPALVARRGTFRASAMVTPDSLQLFLRSGLLPAEEGSR